MSKTTHLLGGSWTHDLTLPLLLQGEEVPFELEIIGIEMA